MRAMVYTSATATAAELHAFGSVLQVVPKEHLREAALAIARELGSAKRVAMISPDSGSRYLTTALFG